MVPTLSGSSCAHAATSATRRPSRIFVCKCLCGVMPLGDTAWAAAGDAANGAVHGWPRQMGANNAAQSGRNEHRFGIIFCARRLFSFYVNLHIKLNERRFLSHFLARFLAPLLAPFAGTVFRHHFLSPLFVTTCWHNLLASLFGITFWHHYLAQVFGTTVWHNPVVEFVCQYLGYDLACLCVHPGHNSQTDLA
jgi:hypothetical protein